MARTIAPKRSERWSRGQEYQTVRPFFSDSTSPARARWLRWRATTEKSTEQHSAISLTEHGREHLSRQANSLQRVGSARALKRSGSSARSTSDSTSPACLGVSVTEWLFGDAIVQVFIGDAGLSSALECVSDAGFWGQDGGLKGVAGGGDV